MDNGKMARKTEVECGRELKDNHILASGKMEKFKVSVFMS